MRKGAEFLDEINCHRNAGSDDRKAAMIQQVEAFLGYYACLEFFVVAPEPSSKVVNSARILFGRGLLRPEQHHGSGGCGVAYSTTFVRWSLSFIGSRTACKPQKQLRKARLSAHRTSS